MELQILYEDNAIIVCKKPAGVATQTKRLGQADMESLLKKLPCRERRTALYRSGAPA